MITRSTRALRLAVTWVAAAVVLILISEPLFTQAPPAAQGQAQAARVPNELRVRVARAGRIRVIVELNIAGGHVPEGRLANAAGRLAQRQRLNAQQTRVLSALTPAARRVVRRFETVPYIALEVDSSALATLASQPDVLRVMDDAIVRPFLADSTPMVQSDQAWDAGYDGTGTTVAVLDTGVESTHPFFGGRVVSEACYSGDEPGISSSFCPNGSTEQIGPGAAAPCLLDGCYHGTHVAGIAAGNGDFAGQPFSGVAKGASIMAVQVFSQINDWTSCGGLAPCVGGFTSDIIAGLERVYTVAPALKVASVNLSLGGGVFTTFCDDQPYKPAIDNLRSIGVATIVASGNSAYTSGMMAPACISSAVSVGATDKADRVAWFSNVAPFLSLFAPGNSITSSLTGGSYGTLSGTSMAAPHVAGAWAVMKQALPNADVSTLLAALRQSGRPIIDNRTGSPITVPRARMFQALATVTSIPNPSPVVTALTPSSGRGGVSPLSLTVVGSGFNAFSVVRWNGSDRPTTVISAKKIQALIPSTDLAASGTAEVSVFNPEPAGGASGTMTFTITPPPSLTISAPVVTTGGSETVTLRDGFGGTYDWLAIAAKAAPTSSYIQWVYVGAGVTTRTWTINMPTTAGTYEFRLFPDNGFTLAVTSAPITVEAPPSLVPVINSLSPASAVVGGAAFTLTVNGSNFVNGSVVRWKGSDRSTSFVSATQLRATINAADIPALGTAQVTVFTPPAGGGTSGPLTFTITRPPTLTVSTQNAPSGSPVTVTLTDGAGGSQDWLALASTGAADASYLQWIYVGAGVTARTWTVNMPAAAGTYEFRFFPNGGYNRTGTSPPVTVTAGGPSQPVSLAVSTGSTTGGSSVTVTLTNGAGGTSDWLALAATDAANTSYLQWIYVGTGVTTRTWTVRMPTTAGTYEFRYFPGGGYIRGATSPPVTVIASVPPSLAVSAQSVSGGTAVTVTLTNGFGGGADWLALAATGASNTIYLQWTYVGSGASTRAWTVTMPATPGTYEFRYFPNGGYSRAATSPPVTVN